LKSCKILGIRNVTTLDNEYVQVEIHNRTEWLMIRSAQNIFNVIFECSDFFSMIYDDPNVMWNDSLVSDLLIQHIRTHKINSVSDWGSVLYPPPLTSHPPNRIN
jgi:hypothetical protein